MNSSKDEIELFARASVLLWNQTSDPSKLVEFWESYVKNRKTLLLGTENLNLNL